MKYFECFRHRYFEGWDIFKEDRTRGGSANSIFKSSIDSISHFFK